MKHDSKPEHETNQQPRAARLWTYEHPTPLYGTQDRNGKEIVVSTMAVYDLDSRVLRVQCITPTGNECTVVDCSQWRGPSGSPGAGAAIRAIVEFEDRVIDAVRAWARVQRAARHDDVYGLDRRAREAVGETER